MVWRQGFLALKARGLATLGSFTTGWAFVFLGTTVLIWFGKSEAPTPPAEKPEGALTVYRQMWEVLNLPAVRRLVLVMFTWKVGFAAADSVAALKLMEFGLPKEHMATIATMITPVAMVVSSPTNNPR